MAKSALVFSGRNGLDFIELRQGILRIPEVSLRLREAQRLLDASLAESGQQSVDLLSVVSSDDEMFFRNIQLKSLLAAIAQVGLFDRFAKSQKRADFMVGNSNGDAAMRVCAGLISFEDMVMQSQAFAALRPSEKVVAMPSAVERTPLLSGLTLTEYNAMETRVIDGVSVYAPIAGSSMELRRLVAMLHQEQDVTRFINIGPASALRGSDYRQVGDGEIESLDSIELDPMLGWFWRNVRPAAMALAQ